MARQRENPDRSAAQPPPPPRRRGCSMTMLVLLLVLAALVVAALFYLSGEPNTLAIDVNPQANMITRSESLVVNITVENVGLDPVTITGLGVDADLLDGAVVAETLINSQPVALAFEEKSYPLYGSWTEYALDWSLAGGATMDITLSLTSDEVGAYSGDISVWVEDDLLGLPLARAAREQLAFEVR